jgi:hypothetical protein
MERAQELQMQQLEKDRQQKEAEMMEAAQKAQASALSEIPSVMQSDI